MKYNKFLYKINKYKFYLRGGEPEKRDFYQNKLYFYYNKLKEVINQSGGALSHEDLMAYIEPTIFELKNIYNFDRVIENFERDAQTYDKVYAEIIRLMRELRHKISQQNPGDWGAIRVLRQELQQRIDALSEENQKLLANNTHFKEAMKTLHDKAVERQQNPGNLPEKFNRFASLLKPTS